MKIIDHLKVKSKESLLVNAKESKIFPLFKVYQKIVQFNIIHPVIYSLFLIIEVIQLFFEINIHEEDFISNPSPAISNSISSEIFKILQYVSFSHFINPLYLTFNNFIIIYSITILIIILNFSLLFIVDYLETYYTVKPNQLQRIHIGLGLFNYINIKIFIIPTTFILIKSLKITSFIPKATNYTNSLLINQMTIGSIESVSLFTKIVIVIVSVIAFIMNLYIVVNTAYFFNDLDPLESRLCWVQSYSEIEIMRLMLKFFLVLFNCFPSNMIFAKGICICIHHIFYCYYRTFEWYYTQQFYKLLLLFLDYACALYTVMIAFYRDLIYHIDQFIIIIIICSIFGFVCAWFIEKYNRSKLTFNLDKIKNEGQVCQIIMYLIYLTKNLPNENKSINDPLLFGFYKAHVKTCKNTSCISNIFSELIFEDQGRFSNEIETFELNKSDFNLYCKSNSKDAFEILPDHSKVQCEKVLYSIIICIISSSIAKLNKKSIVFLPIIETYIYIHIFNNPFYALFQIMKYYQYHISYRDKFLYYITLSDVLDKIKDLNSNSSLLQSSLASVTNYYFYSEKFMNTTFDMISTSKGLFYKLINMKPSAKEVLNISYKLGNQIKTLNETFNHVMELNSYDMNILRLYSFIIGKLFSMKKVENQNQIRLLQNIKYFIMTDKIKNSTGNNTSNGVQGKFSIKSFQENSDSALLIISGILENLGDILYCNNLVTSIVGYDKKELIGYSTNKLLPFPISEWHNNIILSLYKTGNIKGISHLTNRLILHKSKILICVDLYVGNLPNINYGLMYICLLKTASAFKLEIGQETQHKLTEIKEDEQSKKSKHPSNNNIIETKTSKDLKKEPLKRPSILKHNLSSIKGLIVNAPKKSMIYQSNETGFCMVDENFNILHMNFYAMYILLNLTKPYPSGKINITKICRDFQKKRIELDNGEIVELIFDVSSTTNQDKKIADETIITTQSMTRQKFKATAITTSKPRVLRISLAKKCIEGCIYYLLILQKPVNGSNYSSGSNDLDSNSDSDNSSMNDETDENILDNTTNTYSVPDALDQFIPESEKTKEYKLEKKKNKLLNSTQVPPFTTISTIIVYILILVILIWVCISFQLELRILTKIQNDLSILNKSQQLISTISHYVIDSLLVIRGNLFPMSNTINLLLLINETMKDEKENIYSLLTRISSDYTSDKTNQLINVLSKTAHNFITVSESNVVEINQLNLEIGLKRFIFSMDFLSSKINYKDMTIEQFFNNDYHNSVKCKMHFLYYNYYTNFQSHLFLLTDSIQASLNKDLFIDQNLLLTLFFLSILFGLLISLTFIVTLYVKENSKAKFLASLGNIYDLFYEEKIVLLTKFEINFESIVKRNHNVHDIKPLLEKDHRFRNQFIKGEDYLNYKESKLFKDTILQGTNMKTKGKLSNESIETLFRKAAGSPRLNNSLLPNEHNVLSYTLNNNTPKVLKMTSATSMKFDKKSRFDSSKTLKSTQEKPKATILTSLVKMKNETFGFKSLDPNENPNLFQRVQPITNKIHKPIEPILENPINAEPIDDDEDEDMKLKSREEDDEDYEKEKFKPYTNYEMSWKGNFLEVIASIILVNSFFLASIGYLYSYVDDIQEILYTSDIIYSREININNMLIGMNFLYLYNDESIINHTTMVEREVNGNYIEEEYRQILENVSESDTFYMTIFAYENKDPCLSFPGFKTDYNIITCKEFVRNGLTFQISIMYLTIHELYTDYINKRQTTISIPMKEKMFNNPILIDMMIQNNFFMRLFQADINYAHVAMYEKKLEEIQQICNVKFGLYVVLIIVLAGVYKFYLMAKLIEKINNLNRVTIFFDEDNYKK